MKNILLLFLASTSLVACMTKEKCEQIDWSRRGWDDGRSGSYASIGSDAGTCRDFGVKVDNEAYASGYAGGIKEYCTYTSGLEAGQRDAYYHNQCPKDLEPAFLSGYNVGKAEHQQKQLREEQEKLRLQNEEIIRQNEALKRQNDELLRKRRGY
ncbi:MAG TPA: DUF2799 domain-containing protein [Bdellovibrionales bacterium]|nr:DUF2799 domain-containing protein [Bdellovibrionales bacterium]